MDNLDINTHNHQQTTEALEVALKGLGMRSKAISGNISNINTPNYQRRTVDFEQTLMKQIQSGNKLSDIPMNKTHGAHYSNDVFKISEIKDKMAIETSSEGSFQANGNNVDIDREMIELSKTGLRYKAVSTMAKKNFETMKGIIRGG